MEPGELPAQPVARAMRPLRALPAAAALLLLLPTPALGHGLGESYDLPVPLWLYLWGAFAAVGASFLVLLVADTSLPAAGRAGILVHVSLRRVGSLVGRGVGVALWFGAMGIGLFGNPQAGLPGTLFWVLIWAGMPIVAALVGNPWPALSPFRTLYELLTRLTGRQLDLGLPYPAALARWPAVALLLLGLLLELTVFGSGLAGFVGWLLLGYTVLTVAGMVAVGPVTWLRNGEVFEVLFGWFGRIGPIGRRAASAELCRECASACDPVDCIDCPECVVAGDATEIELVLRRPLAGLGAVYGAGWSDAAFILLALAGVTFDGLQATALWVAVSRAIEGALAGPLPVELVLTLIGPLGLAVVWLGFLVVFSAAATATRALAAAPHGLAATAGRYAATLLPIAAGYAIAHYVTLLIQGIASLPGMLLDPNALEVDIGWLPAGYVWYLSVGAIVVGHVAAVLLAHREALRLRARRPAVAELPLVALMLGYTVLSLWIIAQPITIEVA